MLKHVIAVGVMFAVAVVASADGPAMQKPLAFPNAGISLSLPEGFELKPSAGPMELVRAEKKRGKEVAQRISLSAYLMESEKITADEYADAMFHDLKSSLTLRNVKLLNKTTMPVAGVQGVARLIGYRSSGEDLTAGQVFFLREATKTTPRVCYVLTIEVAAVAREELLTTLGSVVRYIKVIPFKPATSVKVSKLGTLLPDYRLGYSIRVPLGWYASAERYGLTMVMLDYLQGAISRRLNVIVEQSTQYVSAEDYADQTLRKEMQAAGANRKIEVVKKGTTKMGGLSAYQIILRNTPNTTTAPAEGGREALPEIIIVCRIVCPPKGHQYANRNYRLVLVSVGGDAKTAEQTMDTVAESFEFVESAARPVSSTTAPASQPVKKPVE